MALDVSAIYQGQSQPDIGALYGEALQIQKLRTEQQTNNALKMLAQDPANMTDGLPNQNYLKKIAAINPEKAIQLQAQVGEIQHVRAETAEQTEKHNKEQQLDISNEVRIPVMDAYQKALKDSGGNPFVAHQAGQQALDELSKPWLTGGRLSPEDKAAWNPKFDPDRIQMAIVRSKPPPNPDVVASAWVTGLDSAGRPSELNKITGEVRPTAGGFRPDTQLSLASRAESAETAGAQLLTDPANNQQYWAYPHAKGGPKYTDMEGNSYQPSGGQHIQSGRMYGGVAAAIAAAQRDQMAQGKGPLSADQIDSIAANYQSAVVTGTAEPKASAAELTNLRKMQGNVRAFIGAPSTDGKPASGAYGEAELVKSLMDKGLGHIPGGPDGPAFNKLWNDARSGLGDPNVISLRNALLSLQQENAKVMQGSTGSVAAVSDHMSKEIESMLSGNFNAAQLNAAISTMEAGWANRKTGIDQQVKNVQDQIHGGGSADTGNIPDRSISYLRAHPDLKAQFDARYGAGAAERILGQ